MLGLFFSFLVSLFSNSTGSRKFNQCMVDVDQAGLVRRRKINWPNNTKMQVRVAVR